jgi:hypothetical protein
LRQQDCSLQPSIRSKTPPKLKVRTVVANQIQDAENLRKLFDGRIDKVASEYQSALLEFNQVAEKTDSVTNMRPWVESFGRVLDLKAALSKQLSISMGLEPKLSRAVYPNSSVSL